MPVNSSAALSRVSVPFPRQRSAVGIDLLPADRCMLCQAMLQTWVLQAEWDGVVLGRPHILIMGR